MAAPKAKSITAPLSRPCKACGAPLVFAETDEGKTIPLDASTGPHTYQLVIHEGVARAKLAGAYVSHYRT